MLGEKRTLEIGMLYVMGLVPYETMTKSDHLSGQRSPQDPVHRSSRGHGNRRLEAIPPGVLKVQYCNAPGPVPASLRDSLMRIVGMAQDGLTRQFLFEREPSRLQC